MIDAAPCRVLPDEPFSVLWRTPGGSGTDRRSSSSRGPGAAARTI